MRPLPSPGEDGVSPVIGVVLMVAITVILAAMVAAMAMGLVTFPDDPKQVVVKVYRQGDTIYFTNYGGKDAAEVEEIRCNINGTYGSYVLLSNTIGEINTTQSMGNDPPGTTHIVVVGIFPGDKHHVLLDTTV